MGNLADDFSDGVTTQNINLLRVSAGIYKEVYALLTDLEADLLASISKAVGRSVLTQARYDAMLKLTKDIIESAFDDISSLTVEKMREIADMESQLTIKMGNSAIGAELFTATVGPKALQKLANDLEVMGKPATDWWSRQGEDMTTRFNQQMKLGFINGDTIQQLIGRVRGTKANGYADGIMDISAAHAETLVRTEVLAIANDARMATYQANDDIVKNITWISTLDFRTTIQCFSGETRVAPLGVIKKVFRRLYEGNFLIIRTATGKEIKTTPNHPILTARGWCAAKEIQPGKEIIYSVACDSVRISCPQDVGMPPKFSEIADALFDPSVSDVTIERASADNFHGDGEGGNHDVHVAVVKGDLMEALMSGSGKKIADNLFAWLRFSTSFKGGSLKPLLVGGGLPPIESTVFDACLAEYCIHPTLGPFEFSENVGRAHSLFEQLDGQPHVCQGSCSPRNVLHHAELLKIGRDGGDRGVVAVGDGPRPKSLLIQAEDVVSVSSEFEVCHIYNVETSLGTYIADGFIVKNCRSLDGSQWDLEYNPINGAKPFPGNPPIHWGCRSTLSVVLASWEELSGKKIPNIQNVPEKTRASMDGQVPRSVTMQQWMETRTNAQQDSMLGKGRAQLWRDNKLPIAALTDQSSRPLTTAQLAAYVKSL